MNVASALSLMFPSVRVVRVALCPDVRSSRSSRRFWGSCRQQEVLGLGLGSTLALLQPRLVSFNCLFPGEVA